MTSDSSNNKFDPYKDFVHSSNLDPEFDDMTPVTTSKVVQPPSSLIQYSDDTTEIDGDRLDEIESMFAQPQKLEEGWHPGSPHRDVKELTPVPSEQLKKGINNAARILHKRDQHASMAGNFINAASKYHVTSSVALAVLGAPQIGIPLMIAGTIIGLINNSILKSSRTTFDKAYEALATCNDVRIPDENKAIACDVLRRTEKYVKHWENTRSIVTTMVGFGFGKLAEAAEILVILNDSREKLHLGESEEEEEENPNALSLHHAIRNIEMALEIPHPKETSVISRIKSRFHTRIPN